MPVITRSLLFFFVNRKEKTYAVYRMQGPGNPNGYYG